MATLAQGHQGLRQIAALLRQPLPRFFTWDFALLVHPKRPLGTCGCAITLARVVCPNFAKIATDEPKIPRQISAEARFLGIRVKDYKAIFGLHIADHWAYGTRSAADIEPHDVAAAIDGYLAGTLVLDHFR